jgi:hypothetical protein
MLTASDESLNSYTVSMLDVLEENISTCSSGVRIHTLRILTCFPEVELADGKPCRIFTHCQEIDESLENIVKNVRREQSLARIEVIQGRVPFRLRYTSIRYLLGMFGSFLMVRIIVVQNYAACESVIATFQDIAQSDIKAFWNFYSLI